jgi:RNA polymerase sigma-70 factor (ECF subfamily)
MPTPTPERLSQLTTLWSEVLEATQGSGAAASDAQERLMQRYGGAVYQYLLGVTRDRHAADDLSQEFALRFLRGDFRNVRPEKGRFRNFVKTAVLNLVTDHHRRQRARPPLMGPDTPEPAVEFDPGEQMESQFLASWRQELLTRAWEALEREQQKTDQPLYAALRLKADHPELRAAELARRLGEQLGQEFNENWLRQLLYRARRRFADFLLDDVAQSLPEPDRSQIEDELETLGLLEYCRPALERRAGPGH